MPPKGPPSTITKLVRHVREQNPELVSNEHLARLLIRAVFRSARALYFEDGRVHLPELGTLRWSVGQTNSTLTGDIKRVPCIRVGYRAQKRLRADLKAHAKEKGEFV